MTLMVCIPIEKAGAYCPKLTPDHVEVGKRGGEVGTAAAKYRSCIITVQWLTVNCLK